MEHSVLFSAQQTQTQHNPLIQENVITRIWASVVQLVAKYLRDIESVKTVKFKFELINF